MQKLSVQFKRWCTASEILSEEALRQLILIEQFKNGLPEQIATYISEHQVATVSEAATLADDYALIHKTGFYGTQSFRYDRGCQSVPPECHVKSEGASRPASKFEPHAQSKWDRNRVCNYCLGISHWKYECPVLRGKVKPRDGAKGSALAVSLASQHVDANRPRVDASFAPFICANYTAVSGLCH